MSSHRRGKLVTVYEDPLTEAIVEAKEALVRKCSRGILGEFYGRKLRRYEVDIEGVGVVERNILDAPSRNELKGDRPHRSERASGRGGR